MNFPWRIELFGGLQLVPGDGGEVISRFQTRKTAALLAYLAFHRERATAREVLADIFWPDNDPEAGRNSLRVALNSLRRQLEPPGVPPNAVLFADRTTVRLNPATFVTDVADFEAALRREKQANDDAARIAALTQAAEAYRGPLLSGWYEEWIDLEQSRLAEAYGGVLRRLTGLLVKTGRNEQALEFAARAVHADPLREDTHRLLMRLYAAVGRPESARDHFAKLEKTLRDETDSAPSAATKELLRQILAGDVAVSPSHEEIESPSPAVSPVPDAVAAETLTTLSAATPPERDSGVPLQFTRFFGRDEEIAAVWAELNPLVVHQNGAATTTAAATGSRLVTLSGPGGTGKTRLAVEIAAQYRDAGAGGQCRAFVALLSELTDESQIGPALLAALRVSPQPDAVPLEQIVDALGAEQGGPVLLVLDNLEQMVEAWARWSRSLLDRLPHLRLLVTSRQRLGLVEEREFSLSPLPVPAETATNGAENGLASVGGGETLVSAETLLQWSSCPSVALFVDRARAVRSDFQITPRNAAAIADLCRRLDGLPLAIELTAAWIRLLSPAQMRDRLAERYDLLTSERRENTGPRQRSLRAVMDESWRLLPEDLRPFFAALSVFHGGWTLAAAEAVCDEPGALEMIDLLQQRSLVVARSARRNGAGAASPFGDEAGGGDETESIRFFLLDMVRRYAEETLSPETYDALVVSHRHFFAALAAEAGPALSGAQAETWRERLEADHNNLRAAFASALADDPDTALTMSAAMWRFWYARGHAEEGLRLLERALMAASPQEKDTGGNAAGLLIRAAAMHGAGRLALSLGRTTLALSRLTEAAQLLAAMGQNAYPRTGRQTSISATMIETDRALAARAGGDTAAEQAAYDALARMYGEAEDCWAQAKALYALADAREAAGDPAGAAQNRQEAADACEEPVGNASSSADQDAPLPSIADALLDVGEVAAAQGDYAAALPLLRESLDGFRREGSDAGAARVWERIAIAAWGQGEWSVARAAAEEAFLLGTKGPDHKESALLRRVLAESAAREQDLLVGA